MAPPAGPPHQPGVATGMARPRALVQSLRSPTARIKVHWPKLSVVYPRKIFCLPGTYTLGYRVVILQITPVPSIMNLVCFLQEGSWGNRFRTAVSERVVVLYRRLCEIALFRVVILHTTSRQHPTRANLTNFSFPSPFLLECSIVEGAERLVKPTPVTWYGIPSA